MKRGTFYLHLSHYQSGKVRATRGRKRQKRGIKGKDGKEEGVIQS